VRTTMSHEIIDLYDQYTHSVIDRRTFMERLTLLVGGATAALSTLAFLQNDYARAAIVPPDDARIETGFIEIPGPAGKVRGYQAQLRDKEKLPALIVIHENRGLNPHTQDVVRRFALEGFLAVGPDMLSGAGGTPADEDQARELIQKLEPKAVVADLKALVAHLKKDPESTGRVGVVGFCWGGGMVNQLAVHEETLDAAVAFYGPAPAPEEVAAIRAPLMLHYAERDERINKSIGEYEKALQAHQKDYTIHMYLGAEHAFLNDTNAARYNKEAAELAWKRTAEFLHRHLAA